MPTTITPEEVARVAKLARLGLSEQEIEGATQQLTGILSHFAAIQSINTENVPTSDDVTGLKNVTREDVAEESVLCATDALLAAAPETDNGHIKVRAVFEDV